MNSIFNWHRYRQWTKEKIDDIFHHIGNGEDSSDAIYVMLKAILNYCVNDYLPTDIPKTISISINMFGQNDGVFVIKVNGGTVCLTKQDLQLIVADSEQLHHFLSSLTEENGTITPVVVNALSSYFGISNFYDQTGAALNYVDDEETYEIIDTNEDNCLQFRFVPDKTIFGNYTVSLESVSALVFDFIKDKPNLTILVQQGKKNKPLLFHSESLMDAEARISHAVLYKMIDIQTNDYPDLLSKSRAVTIEIPSHGRSRDISLRMTTIIDAISNRRMDNMTIAYALEMENRLAISPDFSIVSSTMDENYSIKRKVIGLDSEEDKGGYTDFIEYTNVIVGIILPTNI